MSAPRKRWKILADALLTRSISSESEEEVSVRRFRSFDLFHCNDRTTDDTIWHHFYLSDDCLLKIREVEKTVTREELAGFNNSGNVCIWPSEEILCHLCLKNQALFSGKRVIEVGGGMACFAGLAIAARFEADFVLCTDGNEKCVQNVAEIVKANEFRTKNVSVDVLDWTNHRQVEVLRDQFDILISADCLFFDEARTSLVKAIWTLLCSGGVAYVVAPNRGTSLQKFVSLSQIYSFDVQRMDEYDSTITNRHKELLTENPSYDPDLHYPVFVKLCKP